MLRRAILVAAGVAVLAVPAAARTPASRPPVGAYTCTVGAYQQVAGTLRIFRHHRYRFRSSKIGRFTVHGHAITFRSGIWHHRKSARWSRTAQGYEIALIPRGHRAANEFCDRP